MADAILVAPPVIDSDTYELYYVWMSELTQHLNLLHKVLQSLFSIISFPEFLDGNCGALPSALEDLPVAPFRDVVILKIKS